MKNSQEANQPNSGPNPSSEALQSNLLSIYDKQDLFCFLRNEDESQRPKSFFSQNGLNKDIISVTDAEPDVYLEVFYALYHILWPQIEKQGNVSLKDAWTSFIGGSIFKGILCPPEKLLGKKKPKDIKRSFSESEGEKQIFHDLDRVVCSISHFKQKIIDYPGQLLLKEDVIASLDLVERFYQEYRNKVKVLGQAILQASSVSEYDALMDALVDLLEPKAVMMSDIFTNHHWAYRISRNKAQKLLSIDENRRPIGNYSNEPSLHRVAALPDDISEPLVYFKANGGTAIQPEKEYMLWSLYKHLSIPVPETALLILTDVFDGDSDYFYAVQASEAVIGESAMETCKNPEILLDEKAFVEQVIGALLTNPSDGSFKNFKYSPLYKTLIGIDNDLVFKPEFSGKDERKIVNVKSILYLLPKMDLSIPESIKIFFTTLDPHLIVLSWLKELSLKNKEYNLLFARLTFQKTRCIYQNLLPQSETPRLAVCLEQKVLVDPDLHDDSFRPQIVISRDLLSNVSEKLRIIEKTLENNRSVSTQILFQEISPVLGKYYRRLRSQFNDPQEALDALWGEKKEGIDYSEISSLLSQEELECLNHNKTLSDENLIPETFFEEYKKKLVSEGSSPILDRFIQRHSQRKRRNLLDLSQALEELQLLIQEGLTNSEFPRDIIDFCYGISKMLEGEPHLRKEITSMLSNLPSAELKWLLTLEKYFLRADSNVPEDLKRSSIFINGAFMKQRVFVLTESAKQEIFDEQGNIKRNSSLTGRSLVTRFPEKDPEFYLKQCPEFPGFEFASTLFMRLLGINQLPYHDLIILNNSYPVLISQKVGGNPVHKVWNNSLAFNNLDPIHTGLLIIAAMLLNPEDGKEDNMILSSDGKYLIPIDNDHSFLPSTFQKEGNFWNRTAIPALQTKTLLFCLKEMTKPIPAQVRQKILSIDFDVELVRWMSELDKIETRLNNLGDQEQRKKFLEKGTVMRIPFYKQFIHNMYWKAHTIQNILKNRDEVIPLHLLKAIEPFIASIYEDSLRPGLDLQGRFKVATDKLYTKTAIDGSRFSVLNTRKMIEIINISEEDLQNNPMFQRMGPVEVLELLRELIQKRDERSGREQEILCEPCEPYESNQQEKFISLFGKPAVETALEEFFANPKESLVLRGSKLIKSSKLTKLFALTPDQGKNIRFLSLEKSPLLTHRTVKTLAQGCPNLEYLNVSGCVELKKIFMAKEEWPLLARLEAKDCPLLERFVSYSPIKILRIETERKIEIFVEKSTLDVFKITSRTINYFTFALKKKENLEIEYQDQILTHENLGLYFLREEEKLEKYFRDLRITIGKFSILSATDLRVFIKSLNLRAAAKIRPEDIQKIMMLKPFNLKRIDLASNKIQGTSSLEFLIQGDCPKLAHLDLSFNEISDEEMRILTQGNWPLLETLNLQKTKVTAVGMQVIASKSNWPHLKSLNLFGNEIGDEGLELLAETNWPELETLNLRGTKITTTGVAEMVKRSKWKRLKDLNLSCNEIDDETLAILFQGNWPFLETLNIRKTKITVLEALAKLKGSNWQQLKCVNISFHSMHGQELLEMPPENWSMFKILSLDLVDGMKKFFNFLLNAKWLNLEKMRHDLSRDCFPNCFLPQNWDQVEYLDLRSSYQITQNEIEAIVSKCTWPKLKHLDLSCNPQMNDEGLQILTQGNWPLLEILNLDYTNVTKRGFFKFILKTDLPNLERILPSSPKERFPNNLLQRNRHLFDYLDLSWCEVTQNEISIFLEKCHCPQLKYLNLSENPQITDRWLQILAEGNFPRLERLDLDGIGVTIKGLFNFILKAKWPNFQKFSVIFASQWCSWDGLLPINWGQLEDINLSACEITQNEIKVIVFQFTWPKLKYLDQMKGFKYWLKETGLDSKD